MKLHRFAILSVILCGCSSSPQEAPPPPPPADPGYELYTRHCSSCHGWEAVSNNLPDLRMADKATYSNWNELVMKGSENPMGMPPFASVLSPEEVQLIKDYVIRRRDESQDIVPQP